MRIDAITPAALTSQTVAGRTVAPTGGVPFSEVLTDALHQVNELQTRSTDATMRLAAGQVEDISEVMIASEKASIALQMTMQVRNRIVDAYQEVMRMQV